MQAAVGSPGPSSPTSCRIQMLGGLRVTLAGSDVAPAFPRKIGALLAYLACFLDRSHPRDLLIELFWPEVDPDAGRASLRSALPLLRRLLEPPGVTPGSLLIVDRQTVRLDPEQITTDVEEFERDLRDAARAASPSEQATLLERALSGYSGELLPGYYEPWVLTERERLAQEYVHALRQLAAVRVQQGDFEGAIEAVRRAVYVDPLEEEAHFELIRQYAAAGQVAAARRHYLEMERLLKTELEVTPSRSLEELLEAGERMRQISPQAPPASESPERAPPERRLPIPALPTLLTPFFGREEEIAEVGALLENASTRLVTLTGLGGTGKTRLALEIARRVRETASDGRGVAFLALADLTDPRLLGQTIRAALNLPPAGDIDPLEQIAAHLAGQRFLLVLDNFEQLVEGGAAMVQQLLARAPGLVCLLTSRRPLGLRAEREYPVGPLPTPAAAAAPERLLEFASVRLFLNRAQAVRADFQVTAVNAQAVTRLCRALDGIPLALELAAARSPVLTPAQMLEHLSDRFSFLVERPRNMSQRHRTLRAALEWSYQALPEEQRRLLAQLSVFRGGWTLEAAAAVCGDDGVGCSVFGVGKTASDRTPNTGHPTPILDQLLDLRNAALIIAEEAGERMRFQMLETVREYGQECLERHGEAAAMAERHARFFLEWVEDLKRTARERGGVHQEAGFDQIEAEYANFRAALAWSCAVPAAEGESDAARREVGLRLAAALRGFWIVRCLFSDARGWLERLLAQPREAGEERIDRDSGQRRGPGPGPTAAWAGVVLAAGTLAYLRGDGSSARSLLTQSLSAAREAKEAELVIGSLLYLGHLLRAEGDIAGARCLFEESLVVAQETGNAGDIAWSLNSLGLVVGDQGDHTAAWGYFERGLALAREIGETGGVGWSLLNLADAAWRLKDPARAARLYRESLSCFQQIGSQRELVYALGGLARLSSEKGRPTRAAQLLAAAELLREAIGTVDHIAPAKRGAYDAHVTAVRTALGEETFARAWAEGRAMTLEEAIRCALERDDP